MSSDFNFEQFRRDLLAWFAQAQRDLPWRRTRDPYAIWLSETMLQQTRVAAVLDYYERFLKRFPNCESLAEAPEAELLAAWAGLGYYHRARNLQRAARQICELGRFPRHFDELRALAGVGDYTAAAVASIALDLPHAVVDGNVFRVLSRLFADGTDIASPAGKKHFARLAEALLDRARPGDFNQAMMELGATVCHVRNPQCLLCPVAGQCKARAAGTQRSFPVKRLKQKTVRESRIVFWIEQNSHIMVWRRPPESTLMPGFLELPEQAQLPEVRAGETLGSFRHGITFHDYSFSVAAAPAPSDPGVCEWLALDRLNAMPVSTVLKKAARVVAKLAPGDKADKASAAGLD